VTSGRKDKINKRLIKSNKLINKEENSADRDIETPFSNITSLELTSIDTPNKLSRYKAAEWNEHPLNLA